MYFTSKGSGYFESYAEWVEGAMLDHQKLEGGLCVIYLDDGADLVVEQL